ncbi:hypothetical protein EV363DRAFT_1270240 [Boletus edulis]|nr:hypothetical protein EV363DRAFT_1270240 [Boletus edulis]
MSRRHRKVPVGLYHQFTRETCNLADLYAHGRIVSVLEGGYGDRAMSDSDRWVDDTWWSEANLVKVQCFLEKASKPRKSTSARANMDDWLAHTVSLLSALGHIPASRRRPLGVRAWVLTRIRESMAHRERKKPVLDGVSLADGTVLYG